MITSLNLLPTRVTIGGERFQIQTDLSPDELQAIIKYIEEKMEDHLTPSLRADPRKQLTLMAMEIAAELFAARSRVRELERVNERGTETAERLLDKLSSEVEERFAETPFLKVSEDPLEAARVFLSPL